MPAWQKRQPRVQPRMISTETRLWTMLILGTMNFVGGGGSLATMRLTTGLARPSGQRLGAGDRAILQVMRCIELRDVHAGAAAPGLRSTCPRARHCALQDIDDLVDDFLALADDKGIDEGVHRLGVHGGVSAGDDDRVPLVALRRPHRDARQVEHVERVGVERLVGQGKADQVEVGQRVFRSRANTAGSRVRASALPCPARARRRARPGHPPAG